MWHLFTRRWNTLQMRQSSVRRVRKINKNDYWLRHVRYLAKFFLEWKSFPEKLVDKIKTHILCSITFFRKSHRLWDNAEKYGAARGATNNVTIWRIRVACRISKATCTYAHAHAYAPGHSHARMHARAHTQICNTYCFSTATMIRERVSMLRFTYIACLVTTDEATCYKSEL
jgi:hypothetical protein